MKIGESLEFFLNEVAENKSREQRFDYDYFLDVFRVFLSDYTMFNEDEELQADIDLLDYTAEREQKALLEGMMNLVSQVEEEEMKEFWEDDEELSDEELKELAELFFEDEEGMMEPKLSVKFLHSELLRDFLGWFLIRVVPIKPEDVPVACKVVRDYFDWLFRKGLIPIGEKEKIDMVIKEAEAELPRVKRAAVLLKEICEKNQAQGLEEPDPDHDRYAKVIKAKDDSMEVQFVPRRETTPVKINEELAKHLKAGDIVNVGLVKKGKEWYPIEAGFVYYIDILSRGEYA